MSKESYIRGFCKVAEAHGVDPEKLAKYAADAGLGSGTFMDKAAALGWENIVKYLKGWNAGKFDRPARALKGLKLTGKLTPEVESNLRQLSDLSEGLRDFQRGTYATETVEKAPFLGLFKRTSERPRSGLDLFREARREFTNPSMSPEHWHYKELRGLIEAAERGAKKPAFSIPKVDGSAAPAVKVTVK